MSTPRFRVSPQALAAQSTVLTGAELHHLRVRRVRSGGTVVLLDGAGHQRRGVVTALDRRQAVIEFLDEEIAPPESPLRLVLAQAVLKGGKLDLVIEKATELGVAEVLVFSSERSVPVAGPQRLERWTRLATSAAKQACRATVPTIRGPIGFDELLHEQSAALRILFWEDAATSNLSALAQQQRVAPSLLAVVGPEGGFAAREAERAVEAGFTAVTLGKRILRAETAAIAALALCQFVWGDLGRQP